VGGLGVSQLWAFGLREVFWQVHQGDRENEVR
jgi:hypothetical protein